MARPGLPKKYAKLGFKKGWRAFKAAKRKRSTTRRKTPTRRANNPKRRNMARRSMTVPHPSVTGMAAGFSILDDLNRGDVIGDILTGNIGGRTGALTNLTINSQNLIKTEDGRKALVQAVGIAAIGAWARKSFPGTKLGGSKFYFRI